MVKHLEHFGGWFSIRAPYISMTILFVLFCVYGSPSLKEDIGYQITAGIIAFLQIVSMTWPEHMKIVVFTDLLTILWLALIGWTIYVDLYPLKAGPFAIMETPTLAIFVAFCAPLRIRLTNRKYERKARKNSQIKLRI